MTSSTSPRSSYASSIGVRVFPGALDDTRALRLPAVSAPLVGRAERKTLPPSPEPSDNEEGSDDEVAGLFDIHDDTPRCHIDRGSVAEASPRVLNGVPLAESTPLPAAEVSLGCFWKRSNARFARGAWRRRWATLIDQTIFYYGGANGTTLKGEIKLADADIETIVLSSNVAPKGYGAVEGFQISYGAGRTLIGVPDNESDAAGDSTSWIKALRDARVVSVQATPPDSINPYHIPPVTAPQRAPAPSLRSSGASVALATTNGALHEVQLATATPRMSLRASIAEELINDLPSHRTSMEKAADLDDDDDKIKDKAGSKRPSSSRFSAADAAALVRRASDRLLESADLRYQAEFDKLSAERASLAGHRLSLEAKKDSLDKKAKDMEVTMEDVERLLETMVTVEASRRRTELAIKEAEKTMTDLREVLSSAEARADDAEARATKAEDECAESKSRATALRLELASALSRIDALTILADKGEQVPSPQRATFTKNTRPSSSTMPPSSKEPPRSPLGMPTRAEREAAMVAAAARAPAAPARASLSCGSKAAPTQSAASPASGKLTAMEEAEEKARLRRLEMGEVSSIAKRRAMFEAAH